MEPSELRAIAHDAAAFEAFYREHVAAVQSFVARRVDRPELVADLTADILLATIDAAARYRPDRGEPRAWLFGVARISPPAGGTQVTETDSQWRAALAGSPQSQS